MQLGHAPLGDWRSLTRCVPPVTSCSWDTHRWVTGAPSPGAPILWRGFRLAGVVGTRAVGKQLCCRPGTAVNLALAGENVAIQAQIQAHTAHPKPALAEPRPVPPKSFPQPWLEPFSFPQPWLEPFSRTQRWGDGMGRQRRARRAAARRHVRARVAVRVRAGEILPLPFLRYRRVKLQGRGRVRIQVHV
jgi:hypothetical protein